MEKREQQSASILRKHNANRELDSNIHSCTYVAAYTHTHATYVHKLALGHILAQRPDQAKPKGCGHFGENSPLPFTGRAFPSPSAWQCGVAWQSTTYAPDGTHRCPITLAAQWFSSGLYLFTTN